MPYKVLSALLLTPNGEKLATTSEKGIQVRIFDTKTGVMLQEVRRGNEFATIYSIAFSRHGNWLAVSSDSCNLHVFAIKYTESEVNIVSLRKVRTMHSTLSSKSTTLAHGYSS